MLLPPARNGRDPRRVEAVELPEPKRPVRRIVDPLTEFLHEEAVGGIVLLLAAAAALLWANTAPDGYAQFWEQKLTLGAGDVALHLDLRHWVNDALMAVFFFVVGLEIKRELVTGELKDRRAATLPVLAAAGGIALPALIFTAFTIGTPSPPGWAIPGRHRHRVRTSTSSPVERFSSRRPSSTSSWTSHDTGATFEYHGHYVSLLWQSMQASVISCSVRALSHLMVRPPLGLVWSRP